MAENNIQTYRTWKEQGLESSAADDMKAAAIWGTICGSFTPNEIKQQLSKGIDAIPQQSWTLHLSPKNEAFDLLRITYGKLPYGELVPKENPYIVLSIFPEDIEVTALYCSNTPSLTGTKLMRNIIELGKILHKTKVGLDALRAGSYLWPSMGFMVDPDKDHSSDGYVKDSLIAKMANLSASDPTRKYFLDLLEYDHHPLILNKIARLEEDGNKIGKSVLLNEYIGGLVFPLEDKHQEDTTEKSLSLRAMRNLNQHLREKGIDAIPTR